MIKKMFFAALFAVGLASACYQISEVSADTVTNIATVQSAKTYIYTAAGHGKTGRYLKRGSKWKVMKMKAFGPNNWYNLGGNQWIQGNTVTVTAARKVNEGTLKIAGTSVKVQQGNTMVNNAPYNPNAQTWGGNPHLRVNDNQSTHIIGHNVSGLGKITKLKLGASVGVTDDAGRNKTYRVVRTANVNDAGFVIGTSNWVYGSIVAAHQGEQVVMQTCISPQVNRVVWAK